MVTKNWLIKNINIVVKINFWDIKTRSLRINYERFLKK